MNETQESIGLWAKETFPGGNDLSPVHCLRLLQEVVELCYISGAAYIQIIEYVEDELVKASQKTAGQSNSKVGIEDQIAEEMADCEIVLRVLAHRRNVDLQTEVDKKMVVNRRRKWNVSPEGVGYHIKES